MKLESIAGRNFMGGNFSVALGALNLIFGRNDTGKTRLGILLKLLFTGQPPKGVEKKPRAIFDRLSSGKIMGVSGLFEGGIEANRQWEEKGKSVTATAILPEQLSDRTPLVMLDASDYFSRSPRGRVEMVFSVARIEGTQTEIRNELCTYGVQHDTGLDETLQDWLESALEAVEGLRSDAAADVRRFTGTLQGLTQLQLDDKPAARSVEEIDRDIEAERQQAMTKRTRMTLLTEEQQKAEGIELTREELRHKIDAAGNPTAPATDLDTLRRREGPLHAQLAGLRANKTERDEWAQRNQRRLSEIAAVEKEAEALEKQGIDPSELERKIAAVEAAQSKQRGKKCPTCKQALAPKPVKDADKLEEWRREVSYCNMRAGQVKQKRALIDELKRQARPEPPQLAGSIESLEMDLEKVRNDIAAHVKMADVQIWRKQLEETPEPKDYSADIEKLRQESEEHATNATRLGAERKAAESDRQDRKRLAEARAAQEKAVAAETRYKQAKAFLLEKKAQLIEQVFVPLLQTADRFMHGIFQSGIEYREGELGMFNSRQWFTEATFGGAKRALLYAALQCALGAQSPCRIIPMDELGGFFDVENEQRLYENIRQAHSAGMFEQFIGMTARFDRNRPPAEFRIIEATGTGYEAHA